MKEALHNAPRPSLYRNRDFLLASGSRFAAAVGYGAVVVSIMLHLQSSYGAGSTGVWLVTTYLLISSVPMVLLAPWAGHLADTKDSRVLATGAALISALAVAAMGLSTHIFSNYLPALFILTVALEGAMAVASPTWQALLPRIVGEEGTPRAMGTLQATLMLAQLIGPALGGILVGAGGLEFSFWVASGCNLLLACGAMSIRTRRVAHLTTVGPAAAQNTDKSPMKPRMLDGLRVLNADKLLWSLVVLAVFVVLAAEAVNVLEIFLARSILGATATQYGLLAATMAAGLIIGSLASGLIRSERLRLLVFLGSIAWAAVTFTLMGLAPSLSVFFIYTGIAGLGIGALNATFGTLIVTRTPERHRGQVSAITMGLMRAASIGALGIGGVLGSLLDPRTGFVLCGLATLIIVAGLSVVVLRSASQSAASGKQEAIKNQVADVGQKLGDEVGIVPLQ